MLTHHHEILAYAGAQPERRGEHGGGRIHTALVLFAALTLGAWACGAGAPSTGDPDAAPMPDGASSDGATSPDAALAPDAGELPGNPGVRIVFPPSDALTDGDRVLIRGRLARPLDVSELRVNDIGATTSNGFADWEAEIPLSLGTTTLTVWLVDSAGNEVQEVIPRTITRVDTFIGRIAEVAFDRAGGRPLAVAPYPDGSMAVFSLDPDTGVLTVVSAPDSNAHFSCCLDVDEPRGRAVAAEGNRIYTVDLSTGVRRLVSGSGPSFFAREVAVDEARNRVFVTAGTDVFAVDLVTGERTRFHSEDECLVLGADMDTVNDRLLITLDDCGSIQSLPSAQTQVQGESAVVALDPVTGAPKIIADAATGTGPLFILPDRIEVDPANGRAFVLDFLSNTLFRVDLVTGDRRVLASDTVGSGPVFFSRRMAFDEVNDRVLMLDRSRRKVLAVDPATGNRSVLMSLASVGDGPVMRISGSADMIVDAAGDRLLMLNRSRFGTLTIVDLATGDRTLVSGEDAGSGIAFDNPFGLVLDEARDRALVLDSYRSALLAVDLATGVRTALISDLNDGQVKSQFGLVLDAASRRAYYLETTYEGTARLAAVIAVDVDTATRAVLSDATHGAGPVLQEGSSLVLDPAGGRLLIIEYYTGNVVAVDLATGDRALVSPETAGAPTSLATAMHATMDTQAKRVIAFAGPARNRRPLVAVDLATGERAVLAEPGGEGGSGPILGEQGGIVSDPHSGLVYLFDGSNAAILALDPVTREHIIVSR
jgi:DNA-binding beta-propeller fold protein YncE